MEASNQFDCFYELRLNRKLHQSARGYPMKIVRRLLTSWTIYTWSTTFYNWLVKSSANLESLTRNLETIAMNKQLDGNREIEIEVY